MADHIPGHSAITRPLIKWTGGKGRELDVIHASMPVRFTRLIEPFVGGGAVLFSLPSTIPAAVNDMSPDLIGLYQALAADDREVIGAVCRIEAAWTAVGCLRPGSQQEDSGLASRAGEAAASLGRLDPALPGDVQRQAVLSLARKRAALARLGVQNAIVRPEALLCSALKAAVYTALRNHYNLSLPGAGRLAAFWFLREFAYGGMFRTNSAGASNVPYGGMSYDARSMASRLQQIASAAMSERLKATSFCQGDFESFLKACRPGPDDFMFVDPPYDSPFSTYDGAAFGRSDHARLASLLAALDCRWMLVVSQTPFVLETYCRMPGTATTSFRKGYAVNIKQRFEREATHLMVTNYGTADVAPAVAHPPERGAMLARTFDFSLESAASRV